MQINGLVEYTANDIERMARDYLAGRPDSQAAIPTKVDVLLLTTPDVGFDTLSGLVEKYGVEGVVCTEYMSHRLMVLVDEEIADSSDDARYYAAVAEELAHIHIHKGVLLQINSIEDFLEVQNHPEWPRFELDARKYSAAIRMPCHLVDQEAQKCYPEIVDQIGFGQSRQIEAALSARLAKRFAVPLRDMDRRLLTWPCEIYRRVEHSIVECSPYLLGDNPLRKITPYKVIQQRLPNF